MNIITTSGMPLSNFSNLLPSSTSVIGTVKKSALLVLVLATLPTAESMGQSMIEGIVSIAKAAYPYITYGGCLASCLAISQGSPPPFWSYEACVRSCEVYRNQF